MSSTKIHLAAVLVTGLFSVVGCNGGAGTMTPITGEDAGVDAGGGDVDAGEDAGAVCSIPTEGFGASVGTKLRPFTLDQCLKHDDGTGYSQPYEFYNDSYCDSRFTVLSIAAGWCGPCNVESDLFNEEISQVYGPQGVRLIQVIVQDTDGYAPSIDFCNEWVNRHNLVNPELMDPAGTTQIYFPGNSLPSTIIIDETGTIVYREYGLTESLMGLTHKLDELLAPN